MLSNMGSPPVSSSYNACFQNPDKGASRQCPVGGVYQNLLKFCFLPHPWMSIATRGHQRKE